MNGKSMDYSKIEFENIAIKERPENNSEIIAKDLFCFVNCLRNMLDSRKKCLESIQTNRLTMTSSCIIYCDDLNLVYKIFTS